MPHSIARLRPVVDRKTLKAYHLHLVLIHLYPNALPLFLTKEKIAEKCESGRKRKLLEEKFRAAVKSKWREQEPKRIPGFYVYQIDNFVGNQYFTFNPSQNNS